MRRFRSLPGLVVGAVVLLMLGLALARPAGAAVENLVQNPSFEAGDTVPTGWYGPDGEYARVASAAAPAGDYVLQVRTTSGPAVVSQVLAVAASTPYTASAYALLNDPGVDYVEVRINWYKTADGTGPATWKSVGTLAVASGVYQSVSHADTVPDSARSARIQLAVYPKLTDATVWFDDIHFDGAAPAPTPSPTPSSTPTGTASPTPTASPAPSKTALAATATVTDTATRTATHTTTPGLGTPSATSTPTVSPGWELIRITEVLVNPAGTDSDPAAEWFELFNAGGVSVDLTGGTITDNTASDPLPGALLLPGGVLVIGASPAAQQTWIISNVPFAALADGRIGNGLSNSGDRLELRDPAGRVVDTISWGTVGEGKTIGRQRSWSGGLIPAIVNLTSMSPGSVSYSDGDGPTPTPSPISADTPTPTVTPATFMVDPSGGFVVFDNGRVTLAVPPGAVDGAVLLTYAPRAWPDPADGYRTVAGIEILGNRIPGGAAFTSFAQDVTLTYRYDAEQVMGTRPATIAFFDVAAAVKRSATTDQAQRTITTALRDLGVLVFAGETDRSFLPLSISG